MLDEAARLGSGRRLALARMVVRHRLSPVDPLDADATDEAAAAILHDPGSAA